MGAQLNYAAWARRCGPAPAFVATHPTTAPVLATLRLLSPARPPALLHLRDGAVVLYRRAGSAVWQVRFKLWGQRAASDVYDRAKLYEQSGLTLTTRRFAVVAATMAARQWA